MSISEEDISKYLKLAEFCKKFFNLRGPPIEFLTMMKKEFQKKDIEMFMIYLTEKLGKNFKEFSNSLDEYLFSILSEDPSILFADLDLENPSLVSGSRKIIEMNKIESFDSLPVYSEKSAKSALNALIVILMNENKDEMKKDILKLTQSPYFSVLISSGRLFAPELYKRAQILYKENDPFYCPIYQLPITHLHLPMSLFSGYIMEQFSENDKYRTFFFLFAVFQQIILNCSTVKFFITDSTLSSIFSSLMNFYTINPSYILSFYINSFPKRNFELKNLIKVDEIFPSFQSNDRSMNSNSNNNNNNNNSNVDTDFDMNENGIGNHYFDDFNFDFYESNQPFYINQRKSSSQTFNLMDDKETILHYFYDTDRESESQSTHFSPEIIHRQLPNGIFPTFEKASNFLSYKPDTYSYDTLIEDALRYPLFTADISDIFMQKLIEKDYGTVVNLANQILKKIDDIRLTWISQLVFFPIMTNLYHCLNEIVDEYQFEVLFFLFISFYEGISKQGDEECIEVLEKFISTMDEPFRLYLLNFLNKSDDVIVYEGEIFDLEKPINRLIIFLRNCKETNDFDISQVKKYPYLHFSAFIWGVKTLHPNSLKLLSLKFPNYKIMKRFFVYLSSCLKNKEESFANNDESNLIYTINSSDCSFDLLTKFPPIDEAGIRLIILHHLQSVSSAITDIKQIQGIILSWRAWIKTFSIEKFVLILIETIIWANENKVDQIKSRNHFLLAERVFASVFLNPIKTSILTPFENQMVFNTETKKFERKSGKIKQNDSEKSSMADRAIKSAIWTTLEYINNYQGFYIDGVGIASFCLLLIISIENDWESEFKKVLTFCIKMLQSSSWKSLKYLFVTNLLNISMSIFEIQDLIQIDMFDLDFLKMNWRFGINYFFVQAEIKRLKQLKLFPLK